MILVLYKAAVIWKENHGLNNLKLVQVLMRDQVIYFLASVSVTHITLFWAD